VGLCGSENGKEGKSGKPRKRGFERVAVAVGADAGVRLGNPKGVLPYSVLLDAQGRVLKQKIGPFEHGEIDAWAR
jgi:hypothetical protein